RAQSAPAGQLPASGDHLRLSRTRGARRGDRAGLLLRAGRGRHQAHHPAAPGGRPPPDRPAPAGAAGGGRRRGSARRGGGAGRAGDPGGDRLGGRRAGGGRTAGRGRSPTVADRTREGAPRRPDDGGGRAVPHGAGRARLLPVPGQRFRGTERGLPAPGVRLWGDQPRRAGAGELTGPAAGRCGGCRSPPTMGAQPVEERCSVPILEKILNAGEGRQVRRLKKVADAVASIEEDYTSLSDGELRALTDEYRKRLADGWSLDDLLPEAFATARE